MAGSDLWSEEDKRKLKEINSVIENDITEELCFGASFNDAQSSMRNRPTFDSVKSEVEQRTSILNKQIEGVRSELNAAKMALEQTKRELQSSVAGSGSHEISDEEELRYELDIVKAAVIQAKLEKDATEKELQIWKQFGLDFNKMAPHMPDYEALRKKCCDAYSFDELTSTMREVNKSMSDFSYGSKVENYNEVGLIEQAAKHMTVINELEQMVSQTDEELRVLCFYDQNQKVASYCGNYLLEAQSTIRDQIKEATHNFPSDDES